MKFEIFKKLFDRLFKPIKPEKVLSDFEEMGYNFVDDEIPANMDLQKTYDSIKDELLKDL